MKMNTYLKLIFALHRVALLLESRLVGRALGLVGGVSVEVMLNLGVPYKIEIPWNGRFIVFY